MPYERGSRFSMRRLRWLDELDETVLVHMQHEPTLRYTSRGPYADEAAARRAIAEALQTPGAVLWQVFEHDALFGIVPRCVGVVHLIPAPPEGLSADELGIVLFVVVEPSVFHRMLLARVIVRRLMPWWAQRGTQDMLLARIHARNIAAERVMQKCGFGRGGVQSAITYQGPADFNLWCRVLGKSERTQRWAYRRGRGSSSHSSPHPSHPQHGDPS